MKKLLDDFKKFLIRGNLMDLAIGFTVGAAFSTIAKSAVEDIIMPPIGLALGGVDFSDLFLLLEPGPEVPPPYATMKAAEAAGAVTLNYGAFLNTVVAFLLVALVMFVIVRVAGRVDDALEAPFGDDAHKVDEPNEKKCLYCRSVIHYKARRCPLCTSDLERSVPEPRNGFGAVRSS